MTDQTGTEEKRHQPQRSGVLPAASTRRGVEHLLAEGVMAAGLARATWSESVPVANLGLPLATVEPHQRRDRAPESGGGRRVAVTGLRVPAPHPFPTATTPARQRLSGPGLLPACSGGELDSHRRAEESGAGPLQGRAAPTTLACTCSHPPTSLPPPQTTPRRCADAFFPRRDSPSPTAHRGHCA